MRAHRHPHGHVGAFDRRQRDARAARAQNDRRDDHVQSVKASRRKKARDGVGATFDQYPAHAASTQRSKDSRRRKLPIGSGQPKKLYARDRRSGISFRRYKMRRTPSSLNTLALLPRRPFGSMTTRAGCCPATRRTVS